MYRPSSPQGEGRNQDDEAAGNPLSGWRVSTAHSGTRERATAHRRLRRCRDGRNLIVAQSAVPHDEALSEQRDAQRQSLPLLYSAQSADE